MLDIIINSNVLRQIATSRFSHFNGTWDALLDLVRSGMEANDTSPGYRENILCVNVPAEGFMSGVVILESGDELIGAFGSRRKNEAPRKSVSAANGRKIPASTCQIIVYRGDVLAETGDNDGNGTSEQWEVISINASPTEGPTPIAPSVLLANHFGLDGGTDTKMSAEELEAQLAISVPYWANKAMAAASDG